MLRPTCEAMFCEVAERGNIARVLPFRILKNVACVTMALKSVPEFVFTSLPMP